MTFSKLAVVSFLAMASATPCFGEENAASPQGDSWASIKLLPDWSGNWSVDRNADGTNANTQNEALQLTPKFKARQDALLAQAKARNNDVHSNTKLCIPVGALRVMTRLNRLYEFLFTPGQITVIPQTNEIRRIYTDGRPHPDKPMPTYGGDSIGHWEGKTLVIDTVAVHPRAEIAALGSLLVGEATGDVHMVEHIYNIAPDRLQIDAVVDSRTALTKPYTFHATHTRRNDWPMMEEVCAQNNLSLDPLSGNQAFPDAPSQVRTVH